MSTVLVLIDAFRHDYLDKSNTKFLWERSKKGHHIEKIQQSLGYCERTEILTGLKGKESGFTAAIGFDPNRSCYRSLRFKGTLNAIDKVFFKLCKLLPLTFMSRLYFSIRRRYIGLAISASCKMKSYGIPIKWLPHFSLTEDYYDHRDDNAFPSLSLFDLLKSNNKTFSVLSFTALGTESDLHSDEDRLKAVISEARTNPKDLYLVYLSTADEYGHKYGPNDERFRFVINGLDKAIEQFSLEMEEIDPECRFLYVGDHGMSQVDTHFDAERELRSLFHSENISIDKDVFFFLDSTMVRIWVNNQEYLDRVNDLMLRSDLFGKNGFWMNEVYASEMSVSWPNRMYGDLLWVASPGVLVYPDFFHLFSPCKGMHGYNPVHVDSFGTCIHYGYDISARVTEVSHLTSVFDLLKDSVGLD